MIRSKRVWLTLALSVAFGCFAVAQEKPKSATPVQPEEPGLVAPGTTFQPEDWAEEEGGATGQDVVLDERVSRTVEAEEVPEGGEEVELAPAAEEPTSLRRLQGGARPEHSFLGFTPLDKRQRFKVGMFSIGPMLQVTESYTDNAFLHHTHQTDDWITVIHPSVTVSVPLGRGPAVRNRIGAFTSLRIIRALRHTGNFNTELFNIGMYGKVEPLGNLTRRLRLQVSTVLTSEAKLPVDDDDREDKFWSSHTSARATYDFSEKTKGELVYDFNRVWYVDRENSMDDYTDHGVTARVYHKLTPKVSGLVGAGYNRHYEGISDDRSYERYRVFVGPEWSPTSRVRGRVEVGYEWNKYWRPNNFTASAVHARGAVEWDPTEKITVAGQVFSTVRNTQRTDYNMLYGVTYRDRGVRVRVVYHIQDRWDAYVEGGYINSEFDNRGVPGKSRRDNLYMASIGTYYRLTRWLSLGLAYMYQRRDSNYNESNFRENSVVISGTVTF